MTERLGSPEERALWQQLAAAPLSGDARQRGIAPSDQDIASWIDGRASAAVVDRVEAALVRDPTLLDAVLQAGPATAAGPTLASDRLAVRGRALVAPPVVAPASSPARWFGGWRLGVQWSAVAVMSVAISVGGFALGGSTQSALAGRSQWRHLLDAAIDLADEVDLPGFSDAGSDQ